MLCACLALLVVALLAACGGPAVPSPRPDRPVATAAPATPTAAAQPSRTDAPAAIAPAAAGIGPVGRTERARVLAVVDGDTIEVDRGRGPERVRYTGVDTPETVHPSRPVEWMGKEASAMNRSLVEGRTVLLERDISETDRYGRLLRYVWVEDAGSGGEPLFVNLALVALGLAQVVTYPPDVRWVDTYLAAQSEARTAGRGLWGTPPGGEAPAAGGAGTDRGGCDPAYPDVCIPPAPPDLDCGDVPYRRFRVLPPDPHRFDGGNDGVGCESG
ncbi:MAG: thermonuclease family protein [Chloroflexota bacterium]